MLVSILYRLYKKYLETDQFSQADFTVTIAKKQKIGTNETVVEILSDNEYTVKTEIVE